MEDTEKENENIEPFARDDNSMSEPPPDNVEPYGLYL